MATLALPSLLTTLLLTSTCAASITGNSGRLTLNKNENNNSLSLFDYIYNDINERAISDLINYYMIDWDKLKSQQQRQDSVNNKHDDNKTDKEQKHG